MKIWTAQYRYSGPDRLDITVKGQDPFGKSFAPSWDMVMGLKEGRISEEEYTDMYLDILMERSKKEINWAEFASKDRTLVCFCKSGEFCHRVILARFAEELFDFVKYEGEIG